MFFAKFLPFVLVSLRKNVKVDKCEQQKVLLPFFSLRVQECQARLPWLAGAWCAAAWCHRQGNPPKSCPSHHLATKCSCG